MAELTSNTQMNACEQEAIILNSAWDMIDGMVNLAMFGRLSRMTDVTLTFETSEHRTLFSILLGDFLSQLKAFKGRSIPFGQRWPEKSEQVS